LRTLHLLMALLGLFLCGYGIHCVVHMHEYAGTGHYWSNPWFYKGHAALFSVIALKIAMGWVKDRETNGKENPRDQGN
jgi:hypothetical protein